MRHKQADQGPDSMRIWTWRPGIAATFDLPAPIRTRLRRVVPTRSSLMRAEHRAAEFAIDRWLNEGGSDARCIDDAVIAVSKC